MSSHSSSVKSPWVDLQVVDMEPSAFPISQAYGIWQPDGWQLCHSSGYIFTTASENDARPHSPPPKAKFVHHGGPDHRPDSHHPGGSDCGEPGRYTDEVRQAIYGPRCVLT